MVRLSASWWREVVRYYLMYLAVGVSFGLFGLVYGVLVVKQRDHWLIALALFGSGFFLARFVWGYLERRLFVKAVAPVRLVSFRVSGSLLEVVGQVAVATILVISVESAMSREPSVEVHQTRVDRSPQIAGTLETLILTV